MEDELKLTALDEEFITVEIEFKSTSTDEELNSTVMEEELKCTAIGELKGTAVKEQSKHTDVGKKVRFGCPVCDRTFNNIGHRNYHMRQIHNVEPIDAKKKIICPILDCNAKFYRSVFLRKHVVNNHKIDLEVEELTFQSYKDFTLWKENMERETKSHYVRGQSTKSLNKGGGLYIFKDYYDCHRSGFYTPNGTGKRRAKKIGSKKIGAFCPSSLKVTRSTVNTYVEIVFCKKHLGHTCDINHLSLTESEKMVIADKISKGMTFSQILHSFKDSVTGPELYRINFLSRRDLVNIANQFKINRKKSNENDEDHVSLWVKKMKECGNESPVVFFKKQGMEHEQLNLDDFMIVIMTKYQIELGIMYSGNNICIDSIHGISSHGFYLTTLLTIDEHSAVFPLAFCISSKIDEDTMMLFFETVKRLVGALDAPVFMSNDDPVFHEAWEKIMSPASFQLLCNWHVDSCWRKNLKKINDKDKQASVYKILRMLQVESNVFEFESTIENFVTELRNDDSTKKFAEYFYKEYFPRLKMWAFCYIRHLGISSVEHLKAMHTILQNIFINGSESDVYRCQVEEVIPALLTLSRDELLLRLDKLLDCLATDWTERIHKGHQQSFKVYKITPLNENSWSVKLYKRIDDYVITANRTCSGDCCLKCLQCNICIHSFFCTCYDNLINLNICKHMHACARFCSDSKSIYNEIASKEEKNQIITHSTEMVEETVDNGASDASIEHEIPSASKTLLTNQLNTIKTMMECSEYTEEQTTQLKSSFDAIISFMTMHGKSNKPFIQVPYKPTVNYTCTVKKPEIQYQNQVITTAGQPLYLYTVNNFQQT